MTFTSSPHPEPFEAVCNLTKVKIHLGENRYVSGSE